MTGFGGFGGVGSSGEHLAILLLGLQLGAKEKHKKKKTRKQNYHGIVRDLGRIQFMCFSRP